MDTQIRYKFGSCDTKELPFSECLPHTIIWHSVGKKPSITVTTYRFDGRFVTIGDQSREDMLAGGPAFLHMKVYNYSLKAALTAHQRWVKVFCHPTSIRVSLSIEANQEIQIETVPNNLV